MSARPRGERMAAIALTRTLAWNESSLVRATLVVQSLRINVRGFPRKTSM